MMPSGGHRAVGVRNVRRKLKALDAGGVLKIYETHLTHILDNPVVVAFVRMAGETRPWGIAYGHARDSEPKYLHVADPRNKAAAAEMVEQFALWLLEKMRVPAFSGDPLNGNNLADANYLQIWMPGKSHLDMLHFFQYEHQKNRSNEEEPTALGALGRLCGWLFTQTKLKGNQMLIDASALLSELYEFPADDFSLRHLGVQLAWIQTEGNLASKRASAIDQLKQPVSVTMLPEVEKSLAEIVPTSTKGPMRTYSASEFEIIGALLKPELRRRWDATVAAHSLTSAGDGRKLNAKVKVLADSQMKDFAIDFCGQESKITSGEPGFTPSPNASKSPVSNALDFLAVEHAEKKWLPLMVHDDKELFKDSVIDGSGFTGTVTQVIEIKGDFTEILWVVLLSPKSQKYFQRRVDDRYAVCKSPDRLVTATKFENGEHGWSVTLTWEKRIAVKSSGKVLPPNSQHWVNTPVAFAPHYFDSYESARKATFNSALGPGSWLMSRDRLATEDSDE